MKIHIVDTNKLPEFDKKVRTNCGKKLVFNPITVQWADGRICSECLEIHRGAKTTSKYTFAIKI